MVLESLLTPEKAEKEPWEMFFIGILYSSVAIFLSFLVFGGEQSSLLLVSLTAMASSILMYNTLKYEAKKDLELEGEGSILKQHSKAISFMIFLFLGFVVSFMCWYLVLDFFSSDVNMAENMFSFQLQTISTLNSGISTGSFISDSVFLKIFENNLMVLLFSLIFSFFYGLGAIFILAWNASVLGVAMALTVKGFLNAALVKVGVVGSSVYFSSVFMTLARYLIHGIPEIVAYFIGGLAGGLLSIASLSRRKLSSKIFKDVLILILIAILFLLVSALIEVYVVFWIF